MSIKKQILENYKAFKMNGIKNHKYTFSQLLIALLMSNLVVYILLLPVPSPKSILTPREDNIFIKVPLKLMIPYEKGSHFSLMNQEQKVILGDAIFIEELKKDEGGESGLYLVEIQKKFSNKILLLSKQELTAIPIMEWPVIKSPIAKIKGESHDESMEINF